MMKHKWLIWIVMLLLALGTATLSAPAIAQEDESAWSEPINLSNTHTDSEFPTIVADPAGGIHVVWLEILDNEHELLYTRLENGNWSTPIDIVPDVSPNWWGPRLASDENGTLHLIYNSTGGIAYSQAFAPQAGSAKAWREPLVLVPKGANIFQFDLALGTGAYADLVCVSYTRDRGGNSGVFVVCSQDGGLIWDAPFTAYQDNDPSQVNYKSSLAVSPDGSIHVVWVFASIAEPFPPLGLRYARSTDGGLTWRTMELAEGPYDDPAVSTCAHPQVHVVWSGTDPDRFKFHRWSVDNGTTWQNPWFLEGGGGLLGLPDLACDNGGALHWLTAIDDFSITYESNLPRGALYHLSFVNGNWSPGEVVMRDVTGLNNMRNAKAALSYHNQLMVVLAKPLLLSESSYYYEIFFASNNLGGPIQPTIVLQEPVSDPTQIPALDMVPDAAADPATLDGSFVQPDTAPWSAVSLGSAAALLAILLVVVVFVTRSRR
jgi:hypothetical protein